MNFQIKGSFLMLTIGLAMIGTACNTSGNIPETTEMKTMMDSISYAVGLNIGKSLDTPESEDLNTFMVFRGVLDVKEDKGEALTEEEIQALFTAFQAEISAKADAELAEKGSKNIEEGIAFLEGNENKEGVKVTASGLQYMVMQAGSGASPTAENVVKVHYHGTLLDGTVFDSSVDRGEPVEFPLNRVIPGWTEGVQLMNVGSKYKFFIPSDLAYGPQGSPPTIPPSSTLIFEVELLDIVETPTP
ncbi:MAG: FKBP-type peptidyl-prolyl cis-trans isomerase [Bacteroidia bacterium]